MRWRDKCILAELGFSSDTWGEVVVVFYSESKVVGLMPLGLKLTENCTLTGRLYSGSRLYNHITSTKITELKCKVCVTQDPLLFYTAVFEKSRGAEIFAREECPREHCDMCITGLCRFHSRGEIIDLKIEVEEYVLCRDMPRVFTRATAAIIEALVWLTKLPHAECKDLSVVLERVEFLVRVVEKSSQRKLYKELAEFIHSRALELVSEIESSRCRSRD